MTKWVDHHGIRQKVEIDLAGAKKRVVGAHPKEKIQTFRRKNTGPILLETML